MTDIRLRHAEPDDHPTVMAVIDEWWGGRPMAAMLPRLFFVHFRPTSFVAEGRVAGDEQDRLLGFLCGLLSQTYDDEAYIHFVGVDPRARGLGVGRLLYERFFDTVRVAGRMTVRCVTSPVNTGSIAFHRALGFETAAAEGYDGPGADRVRFTLRLQPGAGGPSRGGNS